ncbi:hypothetical protein M422DRAFT_261787 [Sphaerobolus stellatus SS14]|uniref:Uncharacterized protein n=1 Tax=Sphaerobolus stellatus (strain SS14) TaxID=990650 RepID=A0A0C9ULT4_SPHS4|nr:hypothetical protein M422DRAFT_261787 [Sphaerobolus stellatus SS14]
MKHSEKKASKIVSFITDSVMEPSYLTKLTALVLKKNWDIKIRQQILASKQGDREFIDWKIEVENLNAIFTTSAPMQALKAEALKNQLKVNISEDLLTNLLNKPAISTDLAAWTLEVKEWDNQMHAEDEHTQHLNHANKSSHSFCHIDKKILLNCLSDPQPPCTHLMSTYTDSDKVHTYPPKLTDAK